MFVNESGIKYASAIVGGYKLAETRSRRMLSALVGERVAVVRTGKRKLAEIIGYCTVTGETFCPSAQFGQLRDIHLVPPGSRYDADKRGKWLYWLADAEPCKPYPVPVDAVRHGRSWLEIPEK